MTVSTIDPISGPYDTDGSTYIYPFGFAITLASQINLIVRDSTGAEETITSGFDVYLYSDAAGGEVHWQPGSAPKPAGFAVYVTRDVAFGQPVQIGNQGVFLPKTHETALDNLAMQILQLKVGVDRSLRLANTDTDPAPTFPTKLARAGKMVAFDDDGNFVATISAVDMAALVAEGLAALDDIGDALDVAAGSASAAVAAKLAAEAARDAASAIADADADAIGYDGTISGSSSTDVKLALDELFAVSPGNAALSATTTEAGRKNYGAAAAITTGDAITSSGYTIPHVSSGKYHVVDLETAATGDLPDTDDVYVGWSCTVAFSGLMATPAVQGQWIQAKESSDVNIIYRGVAARKFYLMGQGEIFTFTWMGDFWLAELRSGPSSMSYMGRTYAGTPAWNIAAAGYISIPVNTQGSGSDGSGTIVHGGLSGDIYFGVTGVYVVQCSAYFGVYAGAGGIVLGTVATGQNLGGDWVVVGQNANAQQANVSATYIARQSTSIYPRQYNDGLIGFYPTSAVVQAWMISR